MERLTRWIDNEKRIAIQVKDATKDECMKKLALYEDTGLQPFDVEDLIGECKTLDANNDELREWEEMAAIDRDKAESKLKVYEDAEEEGKLVFLPVKLGDYAYIPMGGKIYRNKVLSYFISDDSFLVCVEYHPNEFSSSGQWLKASNVFAKSEEAEAKLKEMEADNERRSH